MNGYPITFAGRNFIALASGALSCPDDHTLIVADLHLGKSERMARRGGALLPPFETRDTLTRLTELAQATKACQIFLLGDVFDDDRARESLDRSDMVLWQNILTATPCTILAGNHDPDGQAEAMLGNITLRHIAGAGPDISGHYHPKARLNNITRPAFLIGKSHLILPAFGTFTGGLLATAPVLTDLVGPGIAILTGPRPIAIPYGQTA
ncbi:ligase-associated DNA damage response endonuclease PdeM [Pseudorhodobacter turbinis]|uniref:Ligase-associated DNA damage response endonuclease PdeM n=1 Tax=Pseudorhodobacter turbinis TaxID=2500533 RepID=A0A4P8ED53_9RHOB|nr:ligase-associated DNA damage response endonuclease PdeM [Pseudorhodobacter turbinis]QCO54696.1 ligase-associated DNA damage response endonuclease PdeM [Pseudorhodobacter turbinis]